jgi:hypothetical protein
MIIIIIITFTREGPVGFHQPRQIAPRKGEVGLCELLHVGTGDDSGKGRILSEYVGLLDEDRRECGLLFERFPGPSHVENGGGDAKQSMNCRGVA